MSGFSPETIYERGRQQTLANQTLYYDKFCQLRDAGLALCLETPEGHHWMALDPSSRLEPRLLLACDLAVEGEAGLHRIEFELLDFLHDTGETWGCFYDVDGGYSASFRPLADAEDEDLINTWNARSGRTPIQYVAP